MKDNKDIGKGLDALFAGIDTQLQSTLKQGQMIELPISKLFANKNQPRSEFDPVAMLELENSVKENGILQPIIVRKYNADNYQIIAGERRWRAAKTCQIEMIPTVVIDCNDQQALEIGLVENLQRKNLSALEEAESYQTLMNEFSLTQEQVSKKVSKSRSYIANTLRLLNLPSTIKDYLRSGMITAGHARNLIGMEEVQSIKLANEAIESNISVRDFEKKVRNANGKYEKTKKNIDPDIESICNRLSEKFNSDVIINMSSKDSGQLKIGFKNLLHLDNIISQLG